MMTTAMPESVRVGPLTYAVRVEAEPFISDDKDHILCGQANHDAGIIRVLRRHPDQMFVTFWHELLHAMNQIAQTGLAEDEVCRLAPVLAGVLLDNGYVTRGEAAP